jgi:hypothetical protein
MFHLLGDVDIEFAEDFVMARGTYVRVWMRILPLERAGPAGPV